MQQIPQQPLQQQSIQQAPPRVCYQMSTTNKSFLNMHYMLKTLGVQNNRFHLSLLDPDLAGVSPYDPNLNFMMKQKILREVCNNFWYFIREVVRVPVQGVPGGSQYQLTRGNLALNYCMMYNLNIFYEIPRQQGKSISAIIRYLWIYNYGTSFSEITFLNKKLDDSKLNLARLKEIRELLPSYLRMDQNIGMDGKKVKSPSTVVYIKNANNHNEIKTAAAATSEILAASLLRGRTIPLLWADEWAFIKYNMTVYLNAIPAIKTASINAEKMGKPHGILLTTTPGILSTQEGIEANNMRKEATVFNEKWYDISYQDIKNIIASNLKSNYVYIRFTYQQLGRDQQWFANQCKDLQWHWNEIRREILLEWSESSENCPFTKEELETIHGMTHEPVDRKFIMGKYVLNIYNNRIPLRPDFVPKYPPIIGVDVSGGYYQDRSAVTIIDSRTTEVIADFNDNSISPLDLARFVYEVVCKYYPNAVINVERNGGFGASVLAKLLETRIKRNLYFEIKDRLIEERNDGIRIIRKKQKTKVYGLDSTKDKRDLLIEILRERAKYHKDKFISPIIYDEMCHMETKRNGKVEHSSTTHDDQVFSYLMALYVWYEGTDLRERFNIEKSVIKTDEQIDEPLDGLEEKFSEVVQEIEMIQKDPDDELVQTINVLKQGTGILLKDFLAREQKKEQNMMDLMLQNKAIKEAYAKQKGITAQDVENMFGNGYKAIPDELLFDMGSTDPGIENFEDDNAEAEKFLMDRIKEYEKKL